VFVEQIGEIDDGRFEAGFGNANADLVIHIESNRIGT